MSLIEEALLEFILTSNLQEDESQRAGARKENLTTLHYVRNKKKNGHRVRKIINGKVMWV